MKNLGPILVVCVLAGGFGWMWYQQSQQLSLLQQQVAAAQKPAAPPEEITISFSEGKAIQIHRSGQYTLTGYETPQDALDDLKTKDLDHNSRVITEALLNLVAKDYHNTHPADDVETKQETEG